MMTPEELHNIYRAEEEFWWYQGMRAITRAFLEPVLPPKLSRGLDAGCGTGYNALDFEDRYRIRMYGIDLAPLAIQYCRSKNFYRAAAASLLALPFPAQSFDLVASWDALPHLTPGDADKAIEEMQRVLKPGGWLFLRVPAFRALRSRHSEFIVERHRYRASEMLGKLARNQFQVVRWTYANCFLVPVALLKFRVWEALRQEQAQSGITQSLPPWLSRSLLAVLKLEAALIRRGFRFRLGQSLLVVARKPA